MNSVRIGRQSFGIDRIFGKYGFNVVPKQRYYRNINLMSRVLFCSRRRRRSRSSRSLLKRWNKTVPSPSGFGWELAIRSGIILFCDSATLDDCSRVLVHSFFRILALFDYYTCVVSPFCHLCTRVRTHCNTYVDIPVAIGGFYLVSVVSLLCWLIFRIPLQMKANRPLIKTIGRVFPRLNLSRSFV